jgi:hypothetical protein
MDFFSNFPLLPVKVRIIFQSHYLLLFVFAKDKIIMKKHEMQNNGLVHEFVNQAVVL